ncbi:hypothetical protein RJT34_13868 [Clitoria ternatea]
MILVAIVAEVLEEYTALLARVVEQVFRSAPVPRRVRFLILRRLPFVSPPHPATVQLPQPSEFVDSLLREVSIPDAMMGVKEPEARNFFRHCIKLLIL